MAAEPLATAHQNINYLWTYHSPPMVDVCPTLTAAQSRHSIVIPVLTSVDGIKYAGVLCVVPSATSTFKWSVRYTTSYVYPTTTWTSWASATGVAGTANTVSAIAIAAATLPANAVAIELDVEVTGTGTIRVDHLLLYPQADAPTAGVRTSTYVASDDGLLSVATAAIHTEWLNRCKSSPIALLQDRKQCAYSFVQIEGNSVAYSCTSPDFTQLPVGRLWLPYQTGDVTLHCRVIASAASGTTTGCVRLGSVQQDIADRAVFNADRTIQSATLVVATTGDPGMEYVDLVLEAKQSSTLANVRIHAVMIWWEPMG